MGPIYAYEAEGRPRATIYEFDDGHFEKWIGGSPAWRNKNPGNLRPAKAHPRQVGEAWGFAVFPDESTGKQAMVAQLERPLYRDLTLKQAIYKYAPEQENPTQNYLKYVVQKSGVAETTILKTLSSADLLRVVNAMVSFEHSIVGEIVVMNSKSMKKYIWHTAHDNKVRHDHAGRDGKVFDFANPPAGGNPGDDYNCRCWAEPIPEQSLKDLFKK